MDKVYTLLRSSGRKRWVEGLEILKKEIFEVYVCVSPLFFLFAPFVVLGYFGDQTLGS